MSDEQARLAALQATALIDSPADAPFDDIVRLASRMVGTPMALFNLVASERQWSKAAVGLPIGLTIPREDAFCPHLIPTGRPMVVEDTHADERFAENPLVQGFPNLRFYAGVPILSREQHVLGALCVLDQRPRTLTPNELEMLEELGRVASRLVEAERRLAEARRARDSLQDTKEDVEAFFANAPYLMNIADNEGRFVQLSRAWEATLGYPLETILNTPFLEFVHPDDHQDTLLAGSVLAAGEDVLDFVNRYRCADGSYRHIKWFSTPSTDGTRVYAVAQDVSKERELERLRRDFVSMVSHELRTPLTSINGTLRLLSAGVVGELPAEAAEMVDIASKNCRRLIRLANDLLDLERLRSGHIEMDLTAVHVDDLLQRAVAELKVLARSRRVRLDIEGDLHCSVLGDEDRLLQVLTNLGSNAVRHSPPGTRVRFECVPHKGSGTRINVHDEGPGIPREQQARIFERFVQLRKDGRRQNSGTGLGLAISYEIMKGLGGDIGVSSAPGEGSTFWIQLPRFLDPGDSGSDLAPVLPRPKVSLLTGDPEASRELIGALKGAGYDLDVAPLNNKAASDSAKAVVIDARRLTSLAPRRWDTLRRARSTVVVTASEDFQLGPVGPPPLLWAGPGAADSLMERLRTITRATGRPRVLVVEDDAKLGRSLIEVMRAADLECTRVQDGEQALAIMPGFDPDLIVLDVSLARVDGFHFVTELRRQYRTGVCVLIYTQMHLDAFRKDALRLGETRFLHKDRHSVREVLRAAEDMLSFLQALQG